MARRHSKGSIKSMIAEYENFGTCEPKTVKVSIRMSENEKADLDKLADDLGCPVSLLVRVLVRQAIDQHENGVSPVGDFKLK